MVENHPDLADQNHHPSTLGHGLMDAGICLVVLVAEEGSSHLVKELAVDPSPPLAHEVQGKVVYLLFLHYQKVSG